MSLKRLSLFLIFLLAFIGCAYKEITLPGAYLQVEREGLEHKVLKGKLFLEGELLLLENKEQGGGSYGTFYLTKDEFLVTLRPPLSSEIILYWHKNSREITMINPAKRVLYLFNFNNLNLEALPYYFLGLREKEATWKKKSFQGEYRFFREELKGEIRANLLYISWKIKEIELTEEKIPYPLTEGFKVRSVNLSF